MQKHTATSTNKSWIKNKNFIITKNVNLKHHIRTCAVLAMLSGFFFSCDDNTSTLGGDIMPDSDGLEIMQAEYKAYTRSFKVDSVLASTGYCYLGQVTDPETNATTTGNFLAQFYLQDNYKLPDDSLMYKENGEIVADSVDLRFYIAQYYGDSLNPMKIGVYELDTLRLMKENIPYYTNIDASEYLNPAPSAIQKEIVYTVKDLTTTETSTSSASRNVRVSLPKSYGTFILSQYYKHPEYYRNSYSFLRHVCPGFYVKNLSGNGTMLTIDISTLNVYFRYRMNDSIYNGVQRMAATEEVLQNTYVENKNLLPLLQETDGSYLKTPAGIFTEVTLPTDSIFSGEHYTDSINSVRIFFPRINNLNNYKYNLSIPGSILMLPKADLYKFFEDGKIADSKTSYITTYNASYNSYTFNNIAQLILYQQNQRKKGAGILPNDSEEVRKQKFAAWDRLNPDWNKAVLVPVVTTYNGTGTLIRVHNDLSLSSTKLSGGNTGKLHVSVVYSRFKNKKNP